MGDDQMDAFDADRAEAVFEHGSGEATEFVGFDDEVENFAGRMDGEIVLSAAVQQGNQQLSVTEWLTDEQARSLGEQLIGVADAE